MKLNGIISISILWGWEEILTNAKWHMILKNQGALEREGAEKKSLDGGD